MTADPVRTYRVAYDDFFAFAGAPQLREQFVTAHERCHDPMMQLVRRYGLRDRSILSVASSIGYEEYCFYESGCRLTFCDIDEIGYLEPYLKQLKPSDGLTYAIGDAQKMELGGQFDACYFSSFTPNELRNRHKNKIRRFVGRPVWYDKPFMDAVVDIAKNALKDGGLFIYQSYASEVDASRPEYAAAVKRQLEPLKLVDLYYYPAYPRVHLIVASRGKPPERQGEITAFHGRGNQPGGVARLE